MSRETETQNGHETESQSLANAALVSQTDSEYSMASKEEERIRIQNEIEAFLASGGKIDLVGSSVLSDPPKKPESKYGSQPI